jgi:hypothetical protein
MREVEMSQQDKDIIIGCGCVYLDVYTEAQYREYLISRFKAEDWRFIDVESGPHKNNFLCACMAWGIVQGLLYCCDTGMYKQEGISYFLLTEKGKQEILA